MRNMISKIGLLFAVLFALGTATIASAQSYPFTSPVYRPNATLSPVTLSAPGSVVYIANGLGTVSVRVSGTCTALAATVQGSNDGTNYTAINVWPIATGAAPTSAASISAVGFWKVNAAGFTNIKVAISALTATCTVAMSGSDVSFNAAAF